MSFDLQKVLQSKAAHRRKLADLPIGEKLTLLDAMCERAVAIRNATPVTHSSVLREEPAPYRTENRRPVKPLDDPDFISAEAALRRASAKAVAHARAAGLESVVRQPMVEKPTP